TDMVRSYVTRLDHVDWQYVNQIFAQMADQGRALLTDAGADPAQIAYAASAEMRYVGQGFEIPVPLPSLSLGESDVPAILDAFAAAYRSRFERCLDESPVEALSWRLSCKAPGQAIQVGQHLAQDSAAAMP